METKGYTKQNENEKVLADVRDYFSDLTDEQIEELIPNLISALSNKTKEMVDTESNKDKDTINVRWVIDDVICKAEEMGLSVTKEQARMAMRFIEKNHDANIGINWEVIGHAIESTLN